MSKEYEGFIDSWEDYVSGVGEGVSEEYEGI